MKEALTFHTYQPVLMALIRLIAKAPETFFVLQGRDAQRAQIGAMVWREFLGTGRGLQVTQDGLGFSEFEGNTLD